VLWIYACLFITCLCSCFYFIYLFNVDHHGDQSRSCACASLSKQRPITVMLASSIRLCYLFLFKAPEWFQFAGR
jgi:hypothetical protein